MIERNNNQATIMRPAGYIIVQDEIQLKTQWSCIWLRMRDFRKKEHLILRIIQRCWYFWWNGADTWLVPWIASMLLKLMLVAFELQIMDQSTEPAMGLSGGIQNQMVRKEMQYNEGCKHQMTSWMTRSEEIWERAKQEFMNICHI